MINKEIAVLEEIKNEMKNINGHLGFYYKNLVSGFEYGVNDKDEFLAASVIKLPLFLYVLAQCSAGNSSFDERLLIEDAEKVPSCGAVNLFTSSLETDILTLCKLMICISDNTATNRLIRRFGINEIEDGFLKMGLEKTVLRRRLFDSESASRGIENTICPREMGMLLEKLYNKEFISADMSELALNVLLKQQINHKMGGKLKGVNIAHKTGEDYMLSNDVGIVFGDNPFVLCFSGHNTNVYLWEDLIRRKTYDLYNTLNASVL